MSTLTLRGLVEQRPDGLPWQSLTDRTPHAEQAPIAAGRYDPFAGTPLPTLPRGLSGIKAPAGNYRPKHDPERDLPMVECCKAMRQALREKQDPAELVQRAIHNRSRTATGVMAKLRMLQMLHGGLDEYAPMDAPPEALLVYSIMRDLLRGRISL